MIMLSVYHFRKSFTKSDFLGVTLTLIGVILTITPAIRYLVHSDVSEGKLL